MMKQSIAAFQTESWMAVRNEVAIQVLGEIKQQDLRAKVSNSAVSVDRDFILPHSVSVRWLQLLGWTQRLKAQVNQELNFSIG